MSRGDNCFITDLGIPWDEWQLACCIANEEYVTFLTIENGGTGMLHNDFTIEKIENFVANAETARHAHRAIERHARSRLALRPWK